MRRRWLTMLSIFALLTAVLFLHACDELPFIDMPTEAPETETETAAETETETETLSVPDRVAALTPSLTPTLEISELTVKNTFGLQDEDGNYSAWIEIHNISEDAVALSDYELWYADYADYATWQFPKKTLQPDEYYVVFANGKGSGDNAAFIPSEDGSLYIVRGETLVHSLRYTLRRENYAYGKDGVGALKTPGSGTPREADLLLISEIMSSNKTYLAQHQNDWVELYNAGDVDLDLHDFFLTKNKDDAFAARLPEKVLSPGEYVLLVSGEDLPFNLSKEGDEIYLYRYDGVLCDELSFGAVTEDFSFIPDEGETKYASPGYENSYEGHLAARRAADADKILRINEVMTSNSRYYKYNGDYYDWVELKNMGDEPVLLSDYYLSDKSSRPFAFRLPELTLQPGELYVCVLTGEGDGVTESDFSLDTDADIIYLTHKDGRVADAMGLYGVPTDRTFGIAEDGEAVYFATPTPGEENEAGYPAITTSPAATLPSGIYKEQITIQLTGDGVLYYTLDGTTPTKKSKRYKGEEIVITSTSAIRVVAYDGDKIPSPTVTLNYFIDVPDYTLPIAKITIKDDDMYGEDGIYTNPYKHWERAANFALYVDGKEELSIDCGIEITGDSSRSYDKKSYQLRFRKTYGASRLKYDIFGDGELTEFKALVLRGGSQDAFRAMLRDEFVTSLVGLAESPDLLYQKYRPVNLYINGEYVGLYYIREKINDHFVTDHLGGLYKDVTMINQSISAKYGSVKEWNALLEYCRTHDLTDPENYAYVESQVSFSSLIDYYIFRPYAADRDDGNVRICRVGDGKWHYALFDLDLCLMTGKDPLAYYLKTPTLSGKKCNIIIYKLLENPEFRELYLSRLGELLNGPLSDESVIAQLDAMVDVIREDMRYDRKKFGMPMPTWETRVKNIRDMLDGRRMAIITDAAILFSLSAEEQDRYFGEHVDVPIETAEETGPADSAEATSPKETAPKETAPKETTPKETAPKETTPKETTPKETKPKETTPKETTPKETTPKETTPKETQKTSETTAKP